MKNKKTIVLFGVCLVVLLFWVVSRIRFHQNDLDSVAAPGNSQTEASEVSSEESDEQAAEPSHITETVESNLVVDADVESQAKTGASYSVESIDFTEDKAKALFKELTGNDVPELNYAGTDFWLEGKDGSQLCFVDNSLSYQRNADMDDTLLSALQIWDEEHRDERRERDLDFASAEECKAQVLAMMQRFTDMDTEILRVNAVSADTIQSFYMQLRDEEVFVGDTPLDLAAMGDAYLVYGGCRQDGLTVYNDTEEALAESNMQSDVAVSCLVKAVVTKEGIRYFDMSSPMVVQEKRDIQLLSAREALDKALPSLTNQILMQKVTVDRIYLEYVAITTHEYYTPDILRPYWVIHYQTEGSSYYHGRAIRINAETGENLAYGK